MTTRPRRSSRFLARTIVSRLGRRRRAPERRRIGGFDDGVRQRLCAGISATPDRPVRGHGDDADRARLFFRRSYDPPPRRRISSFPDSSPKSSPSARLGAVPSHAAPRRRRPREQPAEQRDRGVAPEVRRGRPRRGGTSPPACASALARDGKHLARQARADHVGGGGEEQRRSFDSSGSGSTFGAGSVPGDGKDMLRDAAARRLPARRREDARRAVARAEARRFFVVVPGASRKTGRRFFSPENIPCLPMSTQRHRHTTRATDARRRERRPAHRAVTMSSLATPLASAAARPRVAPPPSRAPAETRARRRTATFSVRARRGARARTAGTCPRASA